jgi:large subunit ribosomal protein L15
MLTLNSIEKGKGKKKGKRYSVGFSAGSKTCGRGQKGQKSRSGNSLPYPGYEGGQTPWHRRIPKRGFKNINRVEYVPINLSVINKFEEGTEITPEFLLQQGVISKASVLVKILGDGELTGKYTVKAHKFSQSAEAKIKSLGGTAEVISC